jgi:hypothetical protein
MRSDSKYNPSTSTRNCAGSITKARMPRDFEPAPREQEFRVQVLLARSLVDDGDRTQPHVASGEPPFGFEHVDDPLPELRLGGLRGHEIAGGIATGAMRGARGDIQECAAGIGVDFDQLRTVAPDVEVEAHEHTGSAAIDTRNRGRSGQD